MQAGELEVWRSAINRQASCPHPWFPGQTTPSARFGAPRAGDGERARAKDGDGYTTEPRPSSSLIPRGLRVLSTAADDDERAGGRACG